MGHLTALTWNLYLGTDIQRVVAALRARDLPRLVAEAWQHIQTTDFPARAEAIAKHIARESPDVIGLQEVWHIATGTAETEGPGSHTLDFLQEICGRLTALGCRYDVAGVSVASRFEVPMGDGKTVRVRDRDVLLLRHGVGAGPVSAGTYEARRTFSFGDRKERQISSVRGWVTVEVETDGRHVLVANTHLETERDRKIQLAQADELAWMLAASEMPIILTGDYNSCPEEGIGGAYGRLNAAGYSDAWSETNPDDPGPTSGVDVRIEADVPALTRRIDAVLFRSSAVCALRPVECRRLGVCASSRTPSGLLPSDHAGVVARFELR